MKLGCKRYFKFCLNCLDIVWHLCPPEWWQNQKLAEGKVDLWRRWFISNSPPSCLLCFSKLNAQTILLEIGLKKKGRFRSIFPYSESASPKSCCRKAVFKQVFFIWTLFNSADTLSNEIWSFHLIWRLTNSPLLWKYMPSPPSIHV